MRTIRPVFGSLAATALALSWLALGCSDGASSTSDGDTGGEAEEDALEEIGDAREDGRDAAPDAAPDAEEDVDDVPDVETDVEDGDAEVTEPEMRFYFGNLHSHTEIWEGEGSPAECYAWARDVADYDFYAVTDHAEFIADRAWADTWTAAEAANEDGAFVAVRGFEWSHTLVGHSCVFNTPGRTSSLATLLLNDFYDWVDTNAGLAQFNHPGREWTNFNDLDFVPDLDEEFFAIEVGNKDDSLAAGEYLSFYAQALDAGWHVAPTANQDNHSRSTNSHRSVFLATELTRAAFFDAMRARRFYASDDPNLRLTFKVGDDWMGARLPTPVGGSVTFTIRVEDDEPIQRVDLIGSGGTVLFTTTPPADTTDFSWEPTLYPGAGQWAYVKVTSTDLLDGEGPSQTAVSAPIWFE